MSSTCHPSRRASARATVDLPGAHEPDQVDLVGRSRDEPLQRLEEAGIRNSNGIRTLDARGPSAASAGDRKRHGHAVIALRIGHAAGGRAAAADRRSRRAALRLDAQAPETRRPAC